MPRSRRSYGSGWRRGCGRPTTRSWTGRCRRPPGRSSASSGRSRPTTRCGSLRATPRPLHPGEAGPAGDRVADRVAALAVGEGAEPAVVRAEVPDPGRHRRLEALAEDRVEEEEAGEDALGDEQRQLAVLAALELRLQPP